MDATWAGRARGSGRNDSVVETLIKVQRSGVHRTPWRPRAHQRGVDTVVVEESVVIAPLNFNRACSLTARSSALWRFGG